MRLGGRRGRKSFFGDLLRRESVVSNLDDIDDGWISRVS